MKILFFSLFILAACDSSESYRGFKDYGPAALAGRERLKLLNNYILETADVQGILWPLSIDDSNEDQVLTVVESSRDLTQLKVEYLKWDLNLKAEYRSHFCDCALYSLCKEKESDKFVDICRANEKKREEITQILPDIVEKLDDLKSSIVQARGNWIEINYVQLDLETKSLQWNENSYNINVKYFKNYTNISVSANDLILNLDIGANASYLEVIGEIQMIFNNEWRKGVVSFQFPKKINTKSPSAL